MKKALVASSMVLGLAFGVQVANADTYTVQAGDTVSQIAYRHGTTVNDIVAQNQLSNPNLIYVGDKLEISTPAVNHQTYTQTPTVTQTKAQQPVVTSKTPSYSAPTTQKQAQPQKVRPQQTQPQNVQPQQSSQQQQTQPQQSNQGLMTKASGQLSQAEINQVAEEMSSRTGESSATWNMIINRESKGSVNVSNFEGSQAFGLFQLMKSTHGSVDSQIDEAVKLYKVQGMQAWQQTAY